MLNYPSPCDKCHRGEICGHQLKCKRYGMWIHTWWKWFNGRHRERKAREGRKECFQYKHPDEVRRYLQEHPCKGCQAEKTCDVPCVRYLRWYDARMEIVRKKVGV